MDWVVFLPKTVFELMISVKLDIDFCIDCPDFRGVGHDVIIK